MAQRIQGKMTCTSMVDHGIDDFIAFRFKGRSPQTMPLAHRFLLLCHTVIWLSSLLETKLPWNHRSSSRGFKFRRGEMILENKRQAFWIIKFMYVSATCLAFECGILWKQDVDRKGAGGENNKRDSETHFLHYRLHGKERRWHENDIPDRPES